MGLPFPNREDLEALLTNKTLVDEHELLLAYMRQQNIDWKLMNQGPWLQLSDYNAHQAENHADLSSEGSSAISDTNLEAWEDYKDNWKGYFDGEEITRLDLHYLFMCGFDVELCHGVAYHDWTFRNEVIDVDWELDEESFTRLDYLRVKGWTITSAELLPGEWGIVSVDSKGRKANWMFGTVGPQTSEEEEDGGETSASNCDTEGGDDEYHPDDKSDEEMKDPEKVEVKQQEDH